MADRPLFILGAGVDKCLGFPLMNDLMFELKRFKEGTGSEIHETLRKHVKGLHFKFDEYAGEKGSLMGAALLGGDGSVLKNVKSLVHDPKITATPEVEALRVAVNRLERIRDGNDLNDDDRIVFARAVGDSDELSTEHLLEPERVQFSDIPRKVLRKALKQAMDDTGTGEQSELYPLLLSLSNFEELLGEFFAGFFTRNATLQKRYFYLSWLFWAYIRVQEQSKASCEGSFYELLTECGDLDVITFNYTRYASMATNGAARYFHGNNEVILDFATRTLDRNSAGIKDTAGLCTFLSSLSCNWGAMPEVKVPGLVPPLIMKPILTSEYLDWWHESATLISKAKTIVIAGYSFAYADEHFNDLIRKRAGGARIVTIDPNLNGVCKNLCRVLSEPVPDTTINEHGLPCRKSGRLAFYEAFADKIDVSQLHSILSAS